MGHSVNPPSGQNPEKRPAPSRRAPSSKLRWLWIVVVLLLVAGGIQLYRISQQPVTFLYRDMTLEALKGVAVNQLKEENFSTSPSGRVTYTQDGREAKTGIDVSFYQQNIDWQAVAGDGIDFAFLRLGYRGYTQGALNTDTCFEANFQGAQDAGLDLGVYFFSQALAPEEAREEAQFVLDTLNGSPLEYPVVFDWEFITHDSEARTHGMDGETLTQCAAAFCQVIEEGGYTPAVYFNRDMGYLYYDLSQLDQYPFWLADYDSVPDFYYRFQLWQYTHTGTVAGIEGNVDLNLDFGPIYDPS